MEILQWALTAEPLTFRVLEHSSLVTLTVEGHCGIFVVDAGALDLQERLRRHEVRTARHAVRFIGLFICTVRPVGCCIQIELIEVTVQLRLFFGGTKLMLKARTVLRITFIRCCNSNHHLF